ncbi:MAG: NAD(P)/FAD-dependent oxidoreductase [Pseudonocardiaceae bacterium]
MSRSPDGSAQSGGERASPGHRDHAGHAVVVERDALPDSPQARRCVPQSRMLHALLPRGQGIIERLFPGYGRDLEAAGAVSLHLPTDGVMLTPAGWLDRRATGWPLLSASRPLYEWAVRTRLREVPGVRILDRHDMTSLVTSQDGRQVTGAVLRPLDTTGGTARELAADLVVDAGGRGSRAPAWLSDAGYDTPPKTNVDPNIGYAARIYRMPAGFSADWQVAMLFAKPPSMSRTGYLFPIEDSQWMVGLMGAADQQPPTDEDGFAAFIRSLRHPLIADVLADAEPVTPIHGYRGTANRLWHYERMSRWPERFVVLGDAVCAFNPVYGQGISTAAVAAETLDACLRRQRRRRPGGDLDGLARRFQRRMARRNNDAWLMSTGEDLRFPTTTGMRVTGAMRLQHRYLDRVLAACTQDPATASTYAQVLGMLARPTALFAPRVLAAAARHRPDDNGTPSNSPPPTRPPAGPSARTGVIPTDTPP